MTAPSPLLAASTEQLAAALAAEWEVPLGLGSRPVEFIIPPYIAAHIAETLLASGVVVPAASLADDETLVRAVAVELCGNGDEYSAARHLMVVPVLRALAAALEDR